MSDDEEQVITSAIKIFPHWQQVMFVIGGAISGFLSILGSGMILYSIVSDWKRKKREVKYRFLLGLSVSDIFTSLVFVFWPLPIPSGSPNVWGARGNQQSCDMQGFFLQISIIGILYNGALSHWFYYSICHGMKDGQYIEKGWDRRIHSFILIFSIVPAVGIIFAEQYNPMPLGCWLGDHPYGKSGVIRGVSSCSFGLWRLYL